MPQNLRRDLVSIETKTTGQGSSFGVTATYPPSQKNVPASIYVGVSNPQVQLQYAKRQQIIDAEIHFDQLVTVYDGDLIQDQATGTKYVVLGYRKPSAPRWITVVFVAAYQGGS
jgi:hypothetical protein